MAKGYYLTAADAAAVRELIAERQLRGQPTKAHGRDAMSRYGPLWRVTTVDAVAVTCTVQRPLTLTSLAPGTEITDVLYDPDNEPAVDDLGVLVRLGNGTLLFHPGGVPVSPAAMIVAQEPMTIDDTAYECRYIDAAGNEGASLQVRRPNGIYISTGAVGFLGIDTEDQDIFIPANLRQEANEGLVVETRTDDPDVQEGKIWLRTDI